MDMKLRWGIIGLGGIAETFATQLPLSRTGVLQAVASRSRDKADAFATRFGAVGYYGDYDQLLDDPDVDIVYIATPHAYHAEWAKRAAYAGKHILCEKPMALNAQEAGEIVDVAKENGVFLMEAFMYRCHPQMARLAELIGSGSIGRVAVVEAAFCFSTGVDPKSRLYRRDLGGGAILDVGCYCTSAARFIAGAALGTGIAEPINLYASGHKGRDTGVDEWASALMIFEGDLTAQLTTSIRMNHENVIRIHGTAGSITVTQPWLPGSGQESPAISVSLDGEEARVETFDKNLPLYALEADAAARYLKNGQAELPSVSLSDSLGNSRALDMWLAGLNLEF